MKIDEIIDDVIERSRSPQQGPYFTKPQQDEILELASKVREKIATPRENELSAYERLLGSCALWFDQTGLRGPLMSEWCNAKNPTYIVNSLRSCAAWEPPQETDRAAERLPEGHRDKRCSQCHRLIYRFDKHKNRIRPDKETGDCPTCNKYRDRLQKQRTAMQKTSDKKRDRRKEKENRGKPDPKYHKAVKKRHEALRHGV